MSGSWWVFGGGVGGMAGAARLAALGCQVTLVEAGRALGRASSGFPWSGFHLDFGCHLFGNESDESTRVLLDLMGGAATPVEIRTASIWEGRRTEGIELPDLGRDADGVLRDLLTAAAREGSDPAQNLAEWLAQRYGPTAADLLDRVARKMFRVPAERIEPEGRAAGPFRRIRVLPDAPSRLLKRLPALDDRIAAVSQPDTMEYYRDRAGAFPARNFYPSCGGMLGFARRATRRLEELGVAIRLGQEAISIRRENGALRILLAHGEEQEADAILWTDGLARLAPPLGLDAGLEERIGRVPMVVFWFDVPEACQGPYSYVHDFDERDLLFRASLPARYGLDRRPEGRAVLCCEVPTDPGSEVWRAPEALAVRIWAEARRAGAVTGEPPPRRLIRSMASTYRVPLCGYRAAAERVRKRLAAEPGLVVPEEWCFTSSATTRAVLAALDAV